MSEEADKELSVSVQNSAVPTKPSASGCASIKPQFIDHHHKPRLVEEYLPKSVVDDFNKGAAGDTNDDKKDDEQPPNKRVKLKGRNKKRPVVQQREHLDNKLCPNIVHDRDCKFGSNCRFNHDVKNYLDSKPLEIDGLCFAYETLGKCEYGVTCVYSKSHITEELKNKVNEELYSQRAKEESVVNGISKDLQFRLRRRKYDFSKANAVSSRVEQEVKVKQSMGKGTASGDGFCAELAACQDSTASQAADGVIDPSSVTELKDSENTSTQTEDVNNHANSPKTAPVQMETSACEGEIKLRPAEQKKIDFSDKLYLAPLTTVGNLPFRRICKNLGADVTCGEMALASNLLQGHNSEWALLKRHESEDLFGVQICGAYPDTMTRCAQVITEQAHVDFIDINCGCPIDLVFKKGEGSALMARTGRFEAIVRSMQGVMGGVPLTVKIRTGIYSDKNIAHTLTPRLRDWGVSLVTVHGRSREQRYTRLADWEYINACSQAASPMPVFGNGDILSFEDYNEHRRRTSVAGAMIARGALMKPWIFTEIKEQRHWDISSSERFDILRDFCNYGLTHWGSDMQGVSTTRRFLLEWLSFLHRYIPVGLLERLPQRINEKPPYYFGRNDLETLMASGNCADWVKISEMLLGPVPDGFTFLPKHKANAYQ